MAQFNMAARKTGINPEVSYRGFRAAPQTTMLLNRSRSRPRPPPTEEFVLNRYDRAAPMNGEAEVKYLDGDFRVIKPGAFVRCAVTGVAIPLEELKYWNVERQEAYATPEAVLRQFGTAGKNG
jgi:hypothetical protein